MSVQLGRVRSVVIAAGGVAAVLGLYWDDAWHTDVGRDTFFSPPHLLLYAGVSVLLAAIASWAWQRSRAEGPAVLRDPVVALPLAGAAVTLVSAPIDELWHQLFGRDAVTWSPPHMLAVAGMLAFAAGLLLAANRERQRSSDAVNAVIGAFLIAAAVTVVMEFETDVPQFPIVTYLPVAVGVLTFAFGLLHRGAAGVWAVTRAAAAYMVLRVAVVGFLAVLGHSLPTVMPTVVAAAAFELAARRDGRRWVVAVATATVLIGSHVVAHAVQPAGLRFTGLEVLVGVVAGTGVAWCALAATGVGRVRPTARRRRMVAAALLGVAVVGWPGPALAHDPGQGEEIAPVTLVASRQGDRIQLRVTGDPGDCATWDPIRMVARRAGRTHTAPLVTNGACRFHGAVQVDDPGRWFVYAEIDVAGERTESWLPIESTPHAKSTVLYRAPRPGTPIGQVVAGVALYLLVVAIFAAVAVTFRRYTPACDRPGPPTPRVARPAPRNVNR